MRLRSAFIAILLSAPIAVRAEDPVSIEYQEHTRFGRQHLSIRNTFRAWAEFHMALRVDPKGLDAWEGLAQTAWTVGDEESTLLALHRALELAPGKPWLHFFLGDVHHRAGRRLAATWHYSEALRGSPPHEKLDPGEEDVARARTAQYEEHDPGIADKAREAAAKPGALARVCLRYFSHAPTDGTMRRDGSEDAGATLIDGCLRRMAFDTHGFPLPFTEAWEATDGLTVDGGTPPVIRAIGRAWNASLTFSAAAGGRGLGATISIRVVGPLTRLAVKPPKAEVQAGERVHLLLSPMDDVGHRLWVPEFRWSVSATELGPLRRAASTQPPAHFFEPHRNILDVATEGLPAEGTKVKVIASDPTGKVQGVSECVLIPGVALSRDREGGIPWTTDYEGAIAKARQEQLPLMVEFTAEW